MIAIRGNKEYNITESEKELFLKDGFDIYDNNGKLIKSKSTKTELEELKKENETLKTELEELKKENETLKTEKENKKPEKK